MVRYLVKGRDNFTFTYLFVLKTFKFEILTFFMVTVLVFVFVLVGGVTFLMYVRHCVFLLANSSRRCAHLS